MVVSSFSKTVMRARALTSLSFAPERDVVIVVTVEVRDDIDALSACVALARLVIVAAVSLCTLVALFAWKLAECAV